MKIILYTGLAILFFTACNKDYHPVKVPDDVPDLATLQQQYTDVILSSADGWYVNYKPDAGTGSVFILMKFHPDGTVSIQSDYQGYTEVQNDVRFRVGGIVSPELVFETYSVWQALYENIGGNFEFLMKTTGADTITLTDAKDDDHESFSMIKATEKQTVQMNDRIKTIRILEEFSNNSDAYFKNFITDNFKASWNLDAAKRQISFAWFDKDDIFRDTSVYSIVDNGIALMPVLQAGSILIDTIYFGEAATDSLKIISAGNAGAGSISVSDIPAFPYAGAADYFLLKERSDRIQGNVQGGEDDVSDNLKPEFEYMKNNLPGFKYIQIYIYPKESSRTSYVAFEHNPGTGNYWNAFYCDVTKGGEDYVVFKLTRKNTGAVKYSKYIEPFFNKLFTDAGVTIVPLGKHSSGRQLIRLVSREDSRNYITLQLWSPKDYYYEP